MREIRVTTATQVPTRDQGQRRRGFFVIPTIRDGLLYLSNGFQKDINTILETEHVTVSDLARSINADRSTVSRWRSGHHVPREPLTLLSLRLWAERLREERKQEEVRDNA